MKKLIICTTALSRKELHKTVFPKYIDLFNQMENFEKYWIINIDKPKQLPFLNTQEESVEYFNTIIPKNIQLHTIVTDNACFMTAVANIVNKIKQLDIIPDLVFWLEDDWEVVDTSFLQYIKFVGPNCALPVTIHVTPLFTSNFLWI